MTRVSFFTLMITGMLVFGCAADDGKADQLNNEGIDFMDQQNYSSALVKFQEALTVAQSDETKAQVYRNLSTVFFNLDVADSSLVYSRKAYEIAPENSFLYYLNKAEYNLMKGNVKEAIPLLEKAMVLEPEKMESYSNLSLVYNGNYGDAFMDLPKALKFAQKAFALNPSPANEEQLASVYFQMEQFAQSTKHYAALMKRFPEVRLYQLYTGSSMYYEGKVEEGMALMEEAAERDETCRQLLEELMGENAG